MKIRIGSRKSDLAQIQSRLVAAALKSVQPDLEPHFVFKDVGVDLNLNLSLVDAESKGLFTKDLTEDLIQGKVDLLVHSWKDLPTLANSQTEIAATLEREDPRDIVFVKKTSLKKSLITLLSSSPRREFNLGGFLKEYVFQESELKFIPIRGNLPTRIKKFLSSEEDAIVLALAAVKRLLTHGNEQSKDVFQKVLDLSQVVVVPVVANPPAPAQGALAIEIRKDRADLKELLSKIKCTQSFADVIAERERLKDFGGGCHLKLGIYQKTTNKGVLKVECGLTPSGERLNSFAWESHKKAPQLSTSEIFDASQLNIFDRKVLKVEKPQNSSGLFLYVSKSEALPREWSLQEKDIVWTAGLETWKKLRKKGLWVSGSQESLGEDFFDFPLELYPKHKAYKLAHKEGVQKSLPLLATYELVANESLIPDLSAHKAFYWPSGSLFKACLKKNPQLLEKIHFCGLGNSFDEISAYLPEDKLFSNSLPRF